MKIIINIKIIPIFIIVFFTFSTSSVHAETPSLFFGTPPAQVQEGDRVTIDVKVQSISKSINAISGSVIFPEALIHVISISKDASIINLWTEDPIIKHNQILFEGIILNPGFQSNSGKVFSITFEAQKIGIASISFTQGALLANDGLGSNVLTNLSSTSFKIVPGQIFADSGLRLSGGTRNEGRLAALPVITDYSALVISSGDYDIYLKGKGEPNALTKIYFTDVSMKSLGEKFISFLQTKKRKLDDILVQNNAQGKFEYKSSKNLVAGVYNATPFLVNNTTNTEQPGLGVQLLVNDNKIVKSLVVLINVLGLLIPIVGLMVIIYFIPWYSWRRMRVIKKKLGLEEEKIELSGHQLERQDKILDKSVENIIDPK
jgi:hypothetical protein